MTIPLKQVIQAIEEASEVFTSFWDKKTGKTVYLSDPLMTDLTEEEKAKTTNAPDWLCEYCGAYNRSDRSVCSKCGGDRSDSLHNYGRLHKLTGMLFGRKK